MEINQSQLAAALGLTRGRVSQLKKEGMPVDSVEAARAWQARRKVMNEKAGHIAQPVKALSLGDLDGILKSVEAGGDDDMDARIRTQTELCEVTRKVFMDALMSGDPAQGKLYSNYDRAIATLLALEKVKKQRQIEDGRLIDADEAASRYGKVLASLRQQIDRAELTVAPAANPENPALALAAYRVFKAEIYKFVSEFGPSVSVKDLDAMDANQNEPVSLKPEVTLEELSGDAEAEIAAEEGEE